MNRERFPLFYAASEDKSSAFWTYTVDWQNVDSIETITAAFLSEMDLSYSDPDRTRDKTRALCNDLLNAQQELPEEILLLQFIQFLVCDYFLNHLLNSKMMPFLYEWVTNALSDEITDKPERSFYPDRLAHFVEAEHLYIQALFSKGILSWAAALFYYSKHVGGLKDLCTHFLDVYGFILEAMVKFKNYSPRISFTLAMISDWCATHHLDEQKTQINQLMYAVYQQDPFIHAKKQIAFFFSLIENNGTPFTRNGWIQIVEADYWGHLSPHERLQFVVFKYSHSAAEIIAHLDDIKNGIDEYHDYVRNVIGTDRLTLAYEMSQIFTIMSKVIVPLFEAGKAKEASILIAYFFFIPADQMLSKVFYIIPNMESGAGYCFDDNLIIHPADIRKNIPEITKLSNSFLRLATTLNDVLDFEVEAQDKLGHPNPAFGPAYYKAVSEHMGFSEVLKQENITDYNGFSIWYGTDFPIQAMMVNEAGLTIPMVQSLLKPLPARQLNNVFLWLGHTNLGECECLVLKEVFENAGITATIFSPEDTTKEQFLAHYTDPSYDLFWVTCHGIFNHYESHSSYLDLGQDIRLTIPELDANLYAGEERRLLVLDACNGATTSLSNSPGSIGIGATTINASQSLISHAWTADNYSGLFLGVLLGIYLAQGNDYRISHQLAILTFREGKEAVKDLVSQYSDNPDFFERLENASIDFDNIYYWGSLTYVI